MMTIVLIVTFIFFSITVTYIAYRIGIMAGRAEMFELIEKNNTEVYIDRDYMIKPVISE